MPNLVRVYVESAADLLNAGMYDAGAIIRLQSGAAQAGPFSNEATAALVSGTQAYTLYDADGAAATWYRTRYENAGGTVTSDWTTAFQAGGEEAGYLCSLYDVKQRLGLTDTSADEELAEVIRQVTDEILGYTGREFVGTPGEVTRTFDVPEPTRTLYVPTGIRSITTLEYASDDQPDTGGTYSTIAAGNYWLRPLAHDRSYGWPATRVALADSAVFYAGRSTVQITGTFGWAAVPPAVARIAASAAVANYMSKGSDGPRAVIGPDGRMSILRNISPADMAILTSYREPLIA
jgi:hypothetical protein